jgi:hypothetical protein
MIEQTKEQADAIMSGIDIVAVVGRLKAPRYGIGYARVELSRVALACGVNDYRIVDRALQRARKAGAIKWDSKRGWTVVEKKA